MRFERCRMEPRLDGSVLIGVTIIDDDESIPQHSEWFPCKVSHVHGWAVCDVVGLANLREKDKDGNDIPGTSPKERAEAWVSGMKVRPNLDHIPIPITKETVREEVDGVLKDVGKDVPQKRIAL